MMNLLFLKTLFAEHRNLQDSILRFLVKLKKPFVMENKNCIHCGNMLYKYDAGKYTCGSMAIPGKIEKRELLLCAMARSH